VKIVAKLVNLVKINEYYGVYNFNHKIAGFSSTIPLLFRSSIPSLNVERINNEFKIRHLNVIKFIKSCESSYSHFQYIDVEEP